VNQTFRQRRWFSDLALNKTESSQHGIANGTTEKAKGATRATAGKVTDDKKSQTEGKSDKAKGFAYNAAGDIKDAVKQSNK
jgi:uncharacterized protein YjbJ (UPF0337 family)